MNGLRRWMRDQMNPLRQDKAWRDLDYAEKQAKRAHKRSREIYEAKRARVHQMLGAK